MSSFYNTLYGIKKSVDDLAYSVSQTYAVKNHGTHVTGSTAIESINGMHGPVYIAKKLTINGSSYTLLSDSEVDNPEITVSGGGSTTESGVTGIILRDGQMHDGIFTLTHSVIGGNYVSSINGGTGEQSLYLIKTVKVNGTSYEARSTNGGVIDIGSKVSTLNNAKGDIDIQINGSTPSVNEGVLDLGTYLTTHQVIKVNGTAVTPGADGSVNITNVTPENHTHTVSDITDFDHTHTKSEITDFSDSDYATASHSHTKAEITDFNGADYATASHTHTKSEITDFSGSDYAAASHNHDDAYSAKDHNHDGVYVKSVKVNGTTYSASTTNSGALDLGTLSSGSGTLSSISIKIGSSDTKTGDSFTFTAAEMGMQESSFKALTFTTAATDANGGALNFKFQGSNSITASIVEIEKGKIKLTGDEQVTGNLTVAGTGTFTGLITCSAEPTANGHLANKKYVDDMVSLLEATDVGAAPASHVGDSTHVSTSTCVTGVKLGSSADTSKGVITITPEAIGAASANHGTHVSESACVLSVGGAAGAVKIKVNGNEKTADTNKVIDLGTFLTSDAITGIKLNNSVLPISNGIVDLGYITVKQSEEDIPVTSVNGFTGAVTLGYEDVGAAPATHTTDLTMHVSEDTCVTGIKLGTGTTINTGVVTITPASIGAAASTHGTHVTDTSCVTSIKLGSDSATASKGGVTITAESINAAPSSHVGDSTHVSSTTCVTGVKLGSSSIASKGEVSITPATIGAAASSHGTHVDATTCATSVGGATGAIKIKINGSEKSADSSTKIIDLGNFPSAPITGIKMNNQVLTITDGIVNLGFIDVKESAEQVPVTSVNGFTGAVTLGYEDVGAAPATHTTDLTMHVSEDTCVTSFNGETGPITIDFTAYASKSHTHTKSQITDFSHTHTVSDITNIADNYAAKSHGTHVTSDTCVTGIKLGSASTASLGVVTINPSAIGAAASSHGTHVDSTTCVTSMGGVTGAVKIKINGTEKTADTSTKTIDLGGAVSGIKLNNSVLPISNGIVDLGYITVKQSAEDIPVSSVNGNTGDVYLYASNLKLSDSDSTTIKSALDGKAATHTHPYYTTVTINSGAITTAVGSGTASDSSHAFTCNIHGGNLAIDSTSTTTIKSYIDSKTYVATSTCVTGIKLGTATTASKGEVTINPSAIGAAAESHGTHVSTDTCVTGIKVGSASTASKGEVTINLTTLGAAAASHGDHVTTSTCVTGIKLGGDSATATKGVVTITPAGIGAAASSHGTHVTSSSCVTSVKGNAESSYRTGQVNLTPANIGAAPSSHVGDSTHVSTSTCVTGIKLGSASTASLGVVTITPSSIGAASSHTHPYVTTVSVNGSSFTATDSSHSASFSVVHLAQPADTRSTATAPNDYNSKFAFAGLKSNSTIGSPSSDSYSYVFGLRGWSDKSGGNAWEIAYNNTGMYLRNGVDTSWGSWDRVVTRSQITKALVTEALGYTPPTENTWRPVVDNLTSTSATSSLSANQGYVLKGLIDGKAASSHGTHVTTSTCVTSLGSASGAITVKINGNTKTVSSGTLDLGTYLTEITKAQVTAALGYTPPSTDTNTWRPVVDNLTSTDATSSLSAKQGSVLKGLIDGKADSSHGTHVSTSTCVTSLASGVGSIAVKINGSTKSVSNGTLDLGTYLTGITKSQVTTALGYTPPTSDTWRGMQNNLTTSNSATTDSLSAYQGYVLLNNYIYNNGHTHSYIGNSISVVGTINLLASDLYYYPANDGNGIDLRYDGTCFYVLKMVDYAWVSPYPIMIKYSDAILRTGNTYSSGSQNDDAVATTAFVQTAIAGKANSSHGTHVTSSSCVTGVKGNAESSYRTGQVNLTPANIGAATSDHNHSGVYAAASHGTHVSTSTCVTSLGGATGAVTVKVNSAAKSVSSGVLDLGTFVTGIKGNAESSYRTGSVNLTCANIGAATSDHNHCGIYAAASHTHSYASTNHSHVALVNTYTGYSSLSLTWQDTSYPLADVLIAKITLSANLTLTLPITAQSGSSCAVGKTWKIYVKAGGYKKTLTYNGVVLLDATDTADSTTYVLTFTNFDGKFECEGVMANLA